jgi:hypothetical protein
VSDAGIILAPLVACFSLGAWLITHRRRRMTTDTPTSNVASAVQGYVELIGSAANHPSTATLSRIRGLPCVWYRYLVQERSNDKWETLQQETSEATFLLRDATGECVVDPDHADISSKHREIKTVGNQRYTEYLLLPGDKLYALGQFETLNPVDTRLDPREDMGNLLAQWKQNRPALLQRFDLNKDGEIDEKEWELARAQAKREVEKQHREMRAQPGFHVLHAPRDGRYFLITNKDPERMARTLQFWSWFFLASFIVALAYFGHLLNHFSHGR